MAIPLSSLMGAGLHADIGGAIQSKITQRERAESIQGGPVEHAFGINIYGVGRVEDILCTFGYAFVAQPDISYGLALHAGDSVLGRTPVPHVGIHRWIRNDAGLYLAAYASVTVSGHRRQRAKVTITFSGVGITLPLGPSADSGFDFSAPLP